jgi:hypothetical protein
MKYYYKIGWVTYYQEELTLKADKQIFEMIKNASDRFGGDEQLTIGNALTLLVKYEILHQFLHIILKPKKDFWYYANFLRAGAKFLTTGKWQPISFEKLSNSETKQIIDDFFLLNQWLVNQLKNWLNNLIEMLHQQPAPKI